MNPLCNNADISYTGKFLCIIPSFIFYILNTFITTFMGIFIIGIIMNIYLWLNPNVQKDDKKKKDVVYVSRYNESEQYQNLYQFVDTVKDFMDIIYYVDYTNTNKKYIFFIYKEYQQTMFLHIDFPLDGHKRTLKGHINNHKKSKEGKYFVELHSVYYILYNFTKYFKEKLNGNKYLYHEVEYQQKYHLYCDLRNEEHQDEILLFPALMFLPDRNDTRIVFLHDSIIKANNSDDMLDNQVKNIKIKSRKLIF